MHFMRLLDLKRGFCRVHSVKFNPTQNSIIYLFVQKYDEKTEGMIRPSIILYCISLFPGLS